ncbi:MAG: hypothetical protein MUC56_08650 [Thermoanaerobaculales bacterium]|jgi:hypothetical protein|nr:hypothetical protein [Thermoanaerobaculales bacterium]
MKRLLKRLVVLAAVVGLGYLLWGQRDRIAGIANNNFRVQGTWYVFEMDRKGFDAYVFSERIITVNGVEWGSYELRSNDEIEVMVGTELSTYHLSFPTEDHMVWSTEVKGELVPARQWVQ